MNQRLSLSRFKEKQPETEQEKRDYILASLMNDIIKTLEISVNSDRQFKSARYEVLAAFHDALIEFDELQK